MRLVLDKKPEERGVFAELFDPAAAHPAFYSTAVLFISSLPQKCSLYRIAKCNSHKPPILVRCDFINESASTGDGERKEGYRVSPPTLVFLTYTPSHITRTSPQCTVIVQNPENKSSPRASSLRTRTTAADGTAAVASAAADGKLGRPGPATSTAEDGAAAATDSHGEIFVYEFTVTVKYVRREIRDLTDRDRETFFNAVSVLQRVPSAVGRAIYGNKYYSKDYFNRIHLYYGKLKGGCRCKAVYSWGRSGTVTMFPKLGFIS